MTSRQDDICEIEQAVQATLAERNAEHAAAALTFVMAQVVAEGWGIEDRASVLAHYTARMTEQLEHLTRKEVN